MTQHLEKAEKPKAKKILLISSCGGHWVQMNRLLPAFEDHSVYFASTEREYSQVVPAGRFYYVPDGSRNSNPLLIIWLALSVLTILIKIRPQVVVTTGAAPGFIALFFAKCFRRKTVWVDSIANVNELSMSGRKVARFADLYVTQWEHLARDNGPHYFGSVV